MALTETIEGTVGFFWYHYDVSADVLYLRRSERRETQAIGEETNDGLILLRDANGDELVGLTVVSWWKRFGKGDFPDSLREICRWIEPLGDRIAA